MIKSFYYFAIGLIGILRNQNLSSKTKLNLYFDYFQLLLLAVQLPFRPTLSDPSIDKVFYTRAFHYSMHYPNFRAFFFLFNEIFCVGEYRLVLNLKNYIDLGANIGLSVLWYRFFNPTMTIYAFEPDNVSFQFLKRNLKEANIRRYFVYKKAVSNKVGRLKFYRILDHVQNLDSGLTLNQKLPFEVSMVATQKLSTLIKKVGKISLVKIDVEGEEYNIFKDIFSTKTVTSIEKIIFENHIFKKKDYRLYLEVLKYLQGIGTLKSRVTSKYTSMNYWENTNKLSSR